MTNRAITFGRALRAKRVERGFTQRELATRARVDDSYISQLERDYKLPSARTLEGIAEALGVDAVDLWASYFQPPEARRGEPFVGREEERAAFNAALEGRRGLVVVAGPPGSGKTTLLSAAYIRRCREGRIVYYYGEGGRLTSYLDFLKGLRDAFPRRGAAFDDFDESYDRCRAIERRLHARFQDPFSMQVSAAEESTAQAELSFAEKYIYRDAERILTDELIAGWLKVFGKAATRAAIIVDDADAIGATVAYWVGRFWERLAEANLLGGAVTVVLAAAIPARLPLPPDVARRALRVTLKNFAPAETAAYVTARGVKPEEDEGEIILSLDGDPRALAFWVDYFEAAAYYRANLLGRAEDAFRRLDAGIGPLVVGGNLKRSAFLALKTRRQLGHLMRLRGRLDEAAAYYAAAAALAEGPAAASSQEIGYLYLDLGHVRRHRGEWDAAVDLYVRADGFFGLQGDRLGIGVAHSSLGTASRLKGDFTRAKQEYRRAAEVLAGIAAGDEGGTEARRWLASTLSNEAIAARLEAERAMAAGERAAARKLMTRAKRLCQEALAAAGDAAESAVAENRFALCLLTEARWRRATGKEAEAAELLAAAVRQHRRALAVFEDLGDKYRVAQVLADLGVAAAAQGLIHDAIVSLKNALGLFQQMGSRYHAAKVFLELGILAEGDERLSYFAEALASAREHNAESLAEVAAAIKTTLGEKDGGPARRFFDEQAALDARLKEMFAAAGRGAL